MSASRLAIMAGLLTLVLAPGSAAAAWKGRLVKAAPAPAPQKASIAQIGGEFFIAQARAEARPIDAVNLGNTVRIDQRILSGAPFPSAGVSQ